MIKIILFGLLLAAFAAEAEEWVNPSDLDLKIAYCIRVRQHTQDLVEPFKNMDGMRELYQERERELKKMRAYLLMKTDLNWNMIIAAASSANKDLEVMDKLVKQCSPNIDLKDKDMDQFNKYMAACVKSRNLDWGYDARKERISSCENPNLLPF